MVSAAILVAFMALITTIQCFRFEIPPGYHKCVFENLQVNSVVLGDYYIVKDLPHANITVQVTTPRRNVLHLEENKDKGQFAFTVTEPGHHKACFWVTSEQVNDAVNIELDWKVGYDAKDWASIAKKHKLQGMELEFLKLDSAVQSIQEKMNYLRESEKQMRDHSELENRCAAWFTIGTLIFCLLAGGWQVWYLLSYFEKKKIL